MHCACVHVVLNGQRPRPILAPVTFEQSFVALTPYIQTYVKLSILIAYQYFLLHAQYNQIATSDQDNQRVGAILLNTGYISLVIYVLSIQCVMKNTMTFFFKMLKKRNFTFLLMEHEDLYYYCSLPGRPDASTVDSICFFLEPLLFISLSYTLYYVTYTEYTCIDHFHMTHILSLALSYYRMRITSVLSEGVARYRTYGLGRWVVNSSVNAAIPSPPSITPATEWSSAEGKESGVILGRSLHRIIAKGRSHQWQLTKGRSHHRQLTGGEESCCFGCSILLLSSQFRGGAGRWRVSLGYFLYPSVRKKANGHSENLDLVHLPLPQKNRTQPREVSDSGFVF